MKGLQIIFFPKDEGLDVTAGPPQGEKNSLYKFWFTDN